MKKRLSVIFVLLLLASQLASCSSETSVTNRSLYAFGTVINFRFYDDNEYSRIDQRIAELEKLWDVTNSQSELSRWNDDHTLALSDETLALLQGSLQICRDTNGRLDVTLLSLSRLWGFQDGEMRVPDADSILSALEQCGYEKLAISNDVVSAPDNVKLDFGAVAKGYAGDLIAKALSDLGCKSCVISLGGNIRTLGEKPDGTAWTIAIRDPKDASSYIGALRFHGERSIVTSGSYQQYFEDNGKKYCHIIDPSTGYPVESSLTSVTVVCADGLKADAYSTALFVMGREDAIEFYRNSNDFEMILVFEDGRIEITEGIASEFETETKNNTSPGIIERGNP